MSITEDQKLIHRDTQEGISTKTLPGISVILPCYNEEKHIIEQGVKQILDILKLLRAPYEIILIDDGSSNNTCDIINQITQTFFEEPIEKKFNLKNLGRGGTVMEGIKIAQYPVVGYLDIDLEIGSQYLPAFYASILQGADIVVAERIYKIHVTPFCLLRLILSRGYIWLSQHLLNIQYPDTEAGFKFFHLDKAKSLIKEVQDTHWFWDTEIIARAHQKGWNIRFLPCLFLRRKDKISSVRIFRDSFSYLKAILKFRKQKPCK